MSVSPLDRSAPDSLRPEDVVAYVLLWAIPFLGALAAMLGLG